MFVNDTPVRKGSKEDGAAPCVVQTKTGQKLKDRKIHLTIQQLVLTILSRRVHQAASRETHNNTGKINLIGSFISTNYKSSVRRRKSTKQTN